MRTLLVGIAVALALGCGSERADGAAREGSERESSEREGAESESGSDSESGSGTGTGAGAGSESRAGAESDESVCSLAESHASLSIGPGAAALRVARRVGDDAPTAIAVMRTDGVTLVRALDDQLVSSTLPVAGHLLGVAPSGEGFVLLTVGPCTAGDSARCLAARALTVGDTAFRSADTAFRAGEPLELPQPSELRSLRVVPEGELVYLARSYRGARPTLDRFGPPRAEGGPPEHQRFAIAEAVDDDEPVEILALAADGAAWALMYRHGATEDSRSGVVLATQLDEHHVEILEDMLVVESVAWVGSSIAMVAAFEFARPAYLRLGADGEVRVPPREVPFGMDVPEPFGGRLVAHTDGRPGEMVIELRNGAGDRRGERIPVPNARVLDVTREPGGFLVAWLDGETLRLAHLRC